ncbi:hypothetical protein [Lentilactobacillus hilgardii]|uniref:Uncharacterized protein n=1 Tax=Lentilactobacillus hilgardii (strain ATCC 8290 / DSM 20176 / CCUG 30140 / JCM 1155 / KCTC 3500 / NBRC 15886 / NCIMB 8040 / NRRL B-1843 / 9) TaxID=1423757 RepID=C0XMU6_LENH9|nr:hypothetical protein [Lentilactobacillus hilgardii]EEI23302.1 hypothetical protein HMPREF0519_2557 [Lentilactobacillus hilgardii DSM 20176 = ATCC 8290]
MKIKKVKFILHNERAKRGMQDEKMIFIFWTDLGVLVLVQWF